MGLFRIKICGVTKPDDAIAAAQAGADAIGLNFYSGSRRGIGPSQAEAIVSALPAGVAKIGVFVNPTQPELQATIDRIPLDYIQLHGDEPPEFLKQLHGLPVIRAFRLGAAGWQPLVQFLAACQSLSTVPAAILVDAFTANGEYGGTGQLCDWSAASQYHHLGISVPLILAGGLTPANVAEAIMAVKPAAVDVASGVESEGAKKDTQKVVAFIREARQAFRTCQAE